jgi:hypothetical protein
MRKHISVFVFTLLLFAGLLTFHRYGESWDDRSLQKYAEKSIHAYTTYPQDGIVDIQRDDLGYYGPAYVMLVDGLSKFLDALLPYGLPDLRHLIYFLTYFAGVLAFHSLSKRWLNPLPALGASLLFATQPVLWGHAFINPKDTPFLSLFLLSLSSGFGAFDLLPSNPPTELKHRSGHLPAFLTAFWIVSIFSLFLFTDAFHTYIENLVLSARVGNANIFTLISKDIHAAPLETYTQRYFTLFLQLRACYFLFITLVLLILWYRLKPDLLKTLFIVLPPALLLGFTTSTRILGPFAGVILTYFAFRRRGGKILPALGMYAVIALMATYLSWPYLWMNPIPHFLESLKEMSLYPWNGTVLFNGSSHGITELPAFYLPVLFAIQMTEPVWILAVAGWITAILGRVKKQEIVELSLLWFVIPCTAFILLRIALYDNFRQVLFILPPVFLMAGVLFEQVGNEKWQAVLMALCLVPGVMGILSLHPYEYIYYNRFIGGVSGAEGRFETDYWATSYREAAEVLNRLASPNAAIWVEGPAHVFSPFAREDLKIYSPGESGRADQYDYVVATTRYDLDQKSYSNAAVVDVIKRGDAVLAVIKQP